MALQNAVKPFGKTIVNITFWETCLDLSYLVLNLSIKVWEDWTRCVCCPRPLHLQQRVVRAVLKKNAAALCD